MGALPACPNPERPAVAAPALGGLVADTARRLREPGAGAGARRRAVVARRALSGRALARRTSDTADCHPGSGHRQLWQPAYYTYILALSRHARAPRLVLSHTKRRAGRATGIWTQNTGGTGLAIAPCGPSGGSGAPVPHSASGHGEADPGACSQARAPSRDCRTQRWAWPVAR